MASTRKEQYHGFELSTASLCFVQINSSDDIINAQLPVLLFTQGKSYHRVGLYDGMIGRSYP